MLFVSEIEKKPRVSLRLCKTEQMERMIPRPHSQLFSLRQEAMDPVVFEVFIGTEGRKLYVIRSQSDCQSFRRHCRID